MTGVIFHTPLYTEVLFDVVLIIVERGAYY
ncbi:hypothetical protein EDC17_105321 [Sphingobacterium alimentarium]|uniref:Uncharacterized protein n=1 Tax=Sphingobacterium alimentarium TaxID=797292 RepID=A0A4R3VR59_9SPHI|nr:hypothetical protein EDC17_105321 [Sphingobacterium alimentarium]